jgi:hypothetical protein
MNVTDAAVVCFTEHDTVEFHCIHISNESRSRFFSLR